MTTTVKKLAQQTLTGGGTKDTLYTVPASTTALIKSISVVNISASGTFIKIWHDGEVDSNVILPAVTLGAAEFANFDGEITMETGDTIVAEAGSSSAITITIYGVQFT